MEPMNRLMEPRCGEDAGHQARRPSNPPTLMSDIDRLEELTHPQTSLTLLPDPSPGSPPASYAMERNQRQRGDKQARIRGASVRRRHLRPKRACFHLIISHGSTAKSNDTAVLWVYMLSMILL